MKFGSVCSGIEAASVAWHPLGWTAAWLSEIEPFPCAVLKHHYPDVPNHGDMTLLPEKILSGQVEAPDLFCGGTPCQAFSVAGLRNSLDDARGNLSLTFVGIANAIDHVRSLRGDSPAIVFWENVPGVLNTKDNAFGCFLGALAGESDPIKPPGERWSNAGCVFGPQRTVAWRVLDAQHFGVAQRRRRVFVVASSRDDINPAEILFEFEGVRRDTPQSRKEGESVAASTDAGFDSGGLQRTVGALCADTHPGAYSGQDAYTGRLIPQPIAFENSRRDGARLYDNVTNTLQAFAGTGGGNGPMVALPIALAENTIGRQPQNGGNGNGFTVGGPMYTLNATGIHGVAQPIAFPSTLSGTQHASAENIAPSMGAKNPMAVVAPTLTASNDPSRSPQSTEVTNQVAAVHAVSMAVRRLTPVECERLQGFPDGYTNIPWRKAAESPDGPRYKALGNSWAVPVVAWIGKRIQDQLQ
jgi:DNA (cytosine-5)-methyltransferase 1